MTDIDITTLDLSAYSKKERKELLKQLEELERGPVIDSNDDRIKKIAETVRGIAAQEKITTTDVVLALGKNLRIRVAVEKRPRKEGASPPVRRKKAAGTKATRKKAEPKYRHPDDPEKTYAGKGPMPKWLKEEIALGREKEEFLVQPA